MHNEKLILLPQIQREQTRIRTNLVVEPPKITKEHPATQTPEREDQSAPYAMVENTPEPTDSSFKVVSALPQVPIRHRTPHLKAPG